MNIGGLQKFSLIDYPGKISAVIFTVGCNFRCGYCHNPELFYEKNVKIISEQDVLSFLETRQNKLDAIVITGGEPTLQPDLIDFIKKIKKLGFLVKLDSNGSNPETLKELYKNKLIDYVAMDIKAPLEKYKQITIAEIDIAKIRDSIKAILKSEIEHEFRTTIVKHQLSIEDIETMAKETKNAELYALQKFIPTKTLNSSFLLKETYSDEEFLEIKKRVEIHVKKCVIR